jgi:enamine deaminase RidA (YjgF/YER057c/UK114 family)
MTAPASKSILPADWARARGFSHAVLAQGTRLLTIAGQIALPKGTGSVSPAHDFAQQWAIALGNVVELVREAGGQAEHLVMLRAFVTDIEEYHAAMPRLGDSWRANMGKHFPAMTLVQVAALDDPNAKVEIEGQAVPP